ncbi:hypothetical protein [Dipodfec virus UOA04_Rod_986]|nr:hypothetical protein [Dipodfec virus UOA04_Rod_986]
MKLSNKTMSNSFAASYRFSPGKLDIDSAFLCVYERIASIPDDISISCLKDIIYYEFNSDIVFRAYSYEFFDEMRHSIPHVRCLNFTVPELIVCDEFLQFFLMLVRSYRSDD